MTDMTYTPLGNSGLMVSRLGVGCNAFGVRTDAAEVQQIVDAALEAGITLFDTADSYGTGASEEVLGQALRGKRDNAVVATKFGLDMQGVNGPDFGVRGSRRYIRTAVEASLRRLGTDYIDLYQFHTPDRITPLEETMDTLTDLVREGKVRYVGCSNMTAWEVVDAHWLAEVNGYAPFISAQNEYSLYNRSAEAELAPACESVGVSILPYFPLAYGLLTGKYKRGEQAPTGSRLEAQAARLANADFDKIEALQAYADARDVPLLHVAIAGLAAQPAVASVISGVSRVGQIASNVAALQWDQSAADLAELDEIATPGVGSGYAPYAS